MTIHPKHIEWIEARGLDPQLAEKLGMATVTRDGKNWLAVPYLEAGQVINHKYRLTWRRITAWTPERRLRFGTRIA